MEYYWNKLLDKFNISAHETEDAPLKTKILRSECPTVPDPAIKNNYLQIIGSIYGFTHCRLDLAFPVNMMTRVMHSPAEQHLKLLQKLLRYINGTNKELGSNLLQGCNGLLWHGFRVLFLCRLSACGR
jgi:hypothetical protein